MRTVGGPVPGSHAVSVPARSSVSPERCDDDAGGTFIINSQRAMCPRPEREVQSTESPPSGATLHSTIYDGDGSTALVPTFVAL